jgi:hypothetical protein
MALKPLERTVLSARYVCGGLSILVGSITMLVTVVHERTRDRVDADRAKGDANLWAARKAMEIALLDYTSILVCRCMDNSKGALSIPRFCTSLKRPGVANQIIDMAKRRHKANDYDENAARRRLDQIVSVHRTIVESDEFARVKKFRNSRAAHATFDDYGMSVSDLMTTYFYLATIGNHFQTIFGSSVYKDDYWELEPMYRQAAAALWQLEPPVDPILVKGTLFFRPQERDESED